MHTGAELSQGMRITWIGALANAVLILFKFTAGVLGRSQALIADAVHSVSDFASDAVVLVGLRAASKEADDDHHFGHGRLETASAALVGLILLGVGVFMAWDSAQILRMPGREPPTWLAAVGALVSIVVKEWMYQATRRIAKRLGSVALLANAWHHRSDALSSVAVLVGLLVMQAWPELDFLDAMVALLVAGLILKVGLDILFRAIQEMTDAAPAPQVMQKIQGCVVEVAGVLSHHDLKVRTSAGRLQVQVHVAVDGKLTVWEGHRIANAVERCLQEGVSEVTDVIVHVDPASPGSA